MVSGGRWVQTSQRGGKLLFRCPFGVRFGVRCAEGVLHALSGVSAATGGGIVVVAECQFSPGLVTGKPGAAQCGGRRSGR